LPRSTSSVSSIRWTVCSSGSDDASSPGQVSRRIEALELVGAAKALRKAPKVSLQCP